MPACEDCGFDAKNAAGLKAHQRKHTAAPEPTETPTAAPVAPPVAPALIAGLRQAGLRVSSVGRSVKMLRPICATCQRGKDIPRDWYTRCTHNPYVSRKRTEEKVPVYEQLADGRAKVIGEDVIHGWEPWPNLVQIAVRPRIDNGRRIQHKRNLGFIFPSEVRSPEFPAGIADMCEYRQCFSQTNLRPTRWGNYCREVEAQLVGQDLRPGALEVGERIENREKQAAQLEAVPL